MQPDRVRRNEPEDDGIILLDPRIACDPNGVRGEDVRAQSETDIIREEQGNPVGCVEHRQKQSRELRHDVIHDTHAWNKLQIGDSWRARVLSDYIQGLPLQEIVHRVERVMKEKLRALTQVMKHHAAGMEGLCLYRPAVQPEFPSVFSSYLYDDHVGIFAR